MASETEPIPGSVAMASDATTYLLELHMTSGKIVRTCDMSYDQADSLVVLLIGMMDSEKGMCGKAFEFDDDCGHPIVLNVDNLCYVKMVAMEARR